MSIFLWIGFIAFVILMLALDLGVFNRKAHVISTREALRWTALCVVLALLFNVFIYFAYENHWLGIGREIGHTVEGKAAALNFFTGYIVEQSLSLDNIFVIALIFSYFGIPALYQHRVLFWGILGALVMRGIMIYIGATLLERFAWMTYVFGALLLATAVKLMVSGEKPVNYDRNPLVRFARFWYPVCPRIEDEKFFTRADGRRAITPLFLVLLIVESTDVMFAVDSIPAILAITTDTFIVFTSNVFAILCLRSMYFALAGMMDKFRYLKTSLVFILAYIGIKMLLSPTLHHHGKEVPTWLSLLLICVILTVGIVASVISARKVFPEVSSSQGPGSDI